MTSFKDRIIAVIDFTIFLILGMPILVVQLVLDIKKFHKSCYDKNVANKYFEESVSETYSEKQNVLTPDFYYILVNYLRNYEPKVVPTK